MAGGNRENEATLEDLATILEVEAVDDNNGYGGGANADTVTNTVVEEQFFTVSYKVSVYNMGIGNLDLGNMVNGFESDLLKNKHFDFVFFKPTSSRGGITWVSFR